MIQGKQGGGLMERDNNVDESFKRAVWVFEGSRDCESESREGPRGTLGKVASISGSESGIK